MGDGGQRLLQRYIRAHGNFAEYAPFGLLLLLLVELGGWPGWLVHCSGSALVGGRAAHAWSFSAAELARALALRRHGADHDHAGGGRAICASFVRWA